MWLSSCCKIIKITTCFCQIRYDVDRKQKRKIIKEIRIKTGTHHKKAKSCHFLGTNSILFIKDSTIRKKKSYKPKAQIICCRSVSCERRTWWCFYSPYYYLNTLGYPLSCRICDIDGIFNYGLRSYIPTKLCKESLTSQSLQSRRYPNTLVLLLELVP